MKKHVSISALALAVTLPATSFAGVTGNIGFVTDYIFRGIFQAASSAYAGADYSGDKGFYAGTWWADVNQGTETDIYGGWTGGSDKVKFKAGYTGYRYLDNFDGSYDEINLGLYAGIFSLDVAVGQYDPSFPGSTNTPGLGTQDYTFTAVTLAPKTGPYYKLGFWGGDYKKNIISHAKSGTSTPSSNYLEIGYDYKLEDQGIDLTVAFTYSDDLVLAQNSTGDYTVVFGIKKTFEPKKK